MTQTEMINAKHTPYEACQAEREAPGTPEVNSVPKAGSRSPKINGTYTRNNESQD